MKIKPFIDRYNWERINYPSENNDWKKIDKSNLLIAFNVFYSKNGKIYPAYILKHNSKHEKQLILALVANKKGWH